MKNPITAKRLASALAKSGLKPQELANASGVSKASISQYLGGSHAPSNISSEKMSKILDVSPLWLMGFDVPMREKIFSKEETEKDIELIHKISLLNERDQKIVLNMIDSMIANKEKKD